MFYEAKRLAGDGKVTAGWLISNATTSVLENTASGEHWISRLGYTVGPVRLRVATPYAETGATIDVDLSVAEVVLLGYALSQADHVSVRNGLITTDRDTPWEDGRGSQGRTIGVFPGVIPSVPRTVWQHEVVHVIQVQQMESTATPLWTIGKDRNAGERRPLFALRHVKLAYPLMMNLVTVRRPYEQHWMEVEAWWLADGTPVQP